ncbi:PDGLE domain-containing protein [Candidatus Hodarchaeum mangrovi]
MNKKYLLGTIILLLGLILITPFADPNPDGLESAVSKVNDNPEGNSLDLGLFSDYGGENSLLFQILNNKFLSIIISAIFGVIITIGIFLVPIFYIKYTRKSISS